MRIGLAQINSFVGDIEGNAGKILDYISRAQGEGAEMVIFPELALTGYPPRDLLLKPSFVERNLDYLVSIVRKMPPGISALVGCIQPNSLPRGKEFYNSVAVVRKGEVLSLHHKSLLPSYDVFDEHRYFEPGPDIALADIDGARIGISICEDLWTIPDVLGRVLYHNDPIDQLARSGAELIVNVSASPFGLGKGEIRDRLLSGHAERHHLPIIYVNQVGGNDELIFAGASCACDAEGNFLARAKSFSEDLLIFDQPGGSQRIERVPEDIEAVHDGLILGIRDYVRKCGFRNGVVIGLSGGIDSSVVAALSARAVGAENVCGIAMPSEFNSPASLSDAKELAKNLGIRFSVIPIESVRLKFESQLAEAFDGRERDVTEENIQARIRGTILMAMSNKFGHLLVSTGNKSELAMGYCTLYGDMAGGLAVISDVPKMMVYDLARFINRKGAIIPENVLVKPASAELRPNQTDQDSLPPYEILDAILKLYVEQEKSAEEIIREGFDPEVVERVIVTVDRNEYKRKQTSIGLKVTSRAFGSGRRMPIAQGYKQKF